MALVMPEGIVSFLPARQVGDCKLAWFPDGRKYEVTRVTLYDKGRIRITGVPPGSAPFAFQRRHGQRTIIEVSADDVIPVVLRNEEDEEDV